MLIDSVADLDGPTVFVTLDLFSADIHTLILTDEADINECWQAWKELILTAINQFSSKKTVLDNNTPPWVDLEVKHLINKKYTALQQYRQKQTEGRKCKLRKLTQET